MSKISSYSLADAPLQLSDRLIGTEAPRPVPSQTPLATKNFSLGELLQLFSSNFPAASLQAVLNTGNKATQNIDLTGSIYTTLIKPFDIEDVLGSTGTTFQVLSKASSGINWIDLPTDNLQSVLDAGNTATQNITIVGNITSTKIIPGNIQDDTAGIGTTGQVLSKTASGIRWITNPASFTAGLNDVLLVGNTATNDINLIGDIFSNTFQTNTGYALLDDGTVLADIFQFANGYNSYLSYSGSGFNTWNLPDESGTIALTSDIPSFTGYVPYTGATSNLDLGTYTLLSGKFLIGPSASANFTRFPNALAVISDIPSGAQHNESLYIGLMSEGTSVGNTWGSGIYGAGYTNTSGSGRGTGVTGEGHVSAATDTGVAVGVRGYAKDVHTGNYNIGLYGDAENGDSGLTYGGNVSLFLANGNIVTSSAAPKTWYLGGNLTFDGQGTAKTVSFTNGATLAFPALTNGSVLFSNGTTIAQDNASFFWDNTNKRLGVGTDVPRATLHLSSVLGGQIYFTDSDSPSQNTHNINSANGAFQIGTRNNNGSFVDTFYQVTTGVNGASSQSFFTQGITRLLINNSGNVGIGATSPGARLDVRAQGALSTDIAFRVRNSADTSNIIETTGEGIFSVVNGSNRISFSSNQISCLSGVSVSNMNIVAGAISMPNSILGIGTTVSGGTTSTLVIGSGNATNTSGTVTIAQSSRGFSPTSGTADFSFFNWNGTINQTGGANGITRGLYINPTLTSAANFRAIETTVGNVILGSTSGNVGIGTSSFWGSTKSLIVGTLSESRLGVSGTGRNGVYLGLVSNASQIFSYDYTLNQPQNLFINSFGGNVSIGSNLNGARLDVIAQGALSTDIAFRVRNSADTANLFEVRGGGADKVVLMHSGVIGQIEISALSIGAGGGNVISSGNRWIFGGSTAAASAQLQIDSTTRGFLPPRMTNAQRLAIASPAVGLMVYCTDVLEGLYINKSTGWTFII